MIPKAILGLDEVGRGPWAGPLVIGACILPREASGELPAWTADLTDSKKLTEKKRTALAEAILDKAPATGLGWVSSREIDSLGLAESLKLAARRAVSEVKLKNAPFTEIIIDGTVNFLAGTPLERYVTTLKKADLLIKEVSAASIIAKVARDAYMTSLATVYPGYGFERHVGYGTAAHRAALAQLGPCPEHRFSFGPVAVASGEVCRVAEDPELRRGRARDTRDGGLARRASANGKRPQRATTVELGHKAESIVANYLAHQGHTILARNHKTPFYEIDIISTKADKIYFTEVKYRKSQSRGTSLEMIDRKKLQQMTFAAEAFLKYSPALKAAYSPLLAAASVSGADFHLDAWLVLR
ncbi:ribonuclease HII [Candidatus Saccharibacteria bacterium]|nr:ribonuclease HII [Candidatus Saccharibacteria bacterium]